MELGDLAAWVAAGIALIACVVAIWQAVSASKQARLAEEQANAAKVQAEEATRASNAAERQLNLALEQWERAKAETELTHRRDAFETISRFVVTALRPGESAQMIGRDLLEGSLSQPRI